MQANAESAVAEFFKMLGSKGNVITQPPEKGVASVQPLEDARQF